MLTVEIYNRLEIDASNTDKVIFTKDNNSFVVIPFDCGDGSCKARFMPMETGAWGYTAYNDDGSVIKSGSFKCLPAAQNNHGSVHTEGFHFRFADGSKYIPIGTTCYAWTHQTEDLREQTLETLKASPFNKLRMCIFPKSMPYNSNDPDVFPFHKDGEGSWDINKPDEVYWRRLEMHLDRLIELGIEADLILFHPYDRWGFASLTQAQSISYLSYCIARLSSFRNVWWSLANEYDLLTEKLEKDWNEYGETLAGKDIYDHPVSIHSCFAVFPKQSWMTHMSMQSSAVNRTSIWQKQYQLPIIIDECGYEGNIAFAWGNLSAFEMVHRFWTVTALGGYCTHGETYHREDEVLWWAKGGTLYGDSPRRIQFLKNILEELPQDIIQLARRINMNPNEEDNSNTNNSPFMQGLMKMSANDRIERMLGLVPAVVAGEDYRLHYLGRSCPSFMRMQLPENGRYKIEVLDIWEMTRTTASDNACGKARVSLPGKEGMAVLTTRIDGEALNQIS